MELAEIRKKAKSQKTDVASPAADSSELKPETSLKETQEDSAPVEVSPPLDISEMEPEESKKDPLDAFFNGNGEIDLATEESYQQALIEQEKDVGEELVQYLAFSLGNEEYALEINNIREIIKPREVTDIPRVPEFVLGIISLRGVIIPVFDLKKRFKLGTVDTSTASRIIVCQQDDRFAGLLVDRITQVARLPKGKIEPLPAILSDLDRDMVKGVGRYKGRMIILLQLSSILNIEAQISKQEVLSGQE